jgi:hypothetical protein
MKVFEQVGFVSPSGRFVGTLTLDAHFFTFLDPSCDVQKKVPPPPPSLSQKFPVATIAALTKRRSSRYFSPRRHLAAAGGGGRATVEVTCKDMRAFRLEMADDQAEDLSASFDQVNQALTSSLDALIALDPSDSSFRPGAPAAAHRSPPPPPSQLLVPLARI